MNVELIMVTLPAISWLLFTLGGTQISPTVPGQKWIRRFLLPSIYIVYALYYATWWQALLVGIPAMIIFSLGYGDSTPWWLKIIIGVMYATIGVSIGISWWNLVTAIGFSVLFFLSNTDLTKDMFTWKIVEGTWGALVGVQLAYVLMGRGLIW